MIPIQPTVIDVTASLAPVMLWVGLAMAGCAAKLAYEALRTGCGRTRALEAHGHSPLAA